MKKKIIIVFLLVAILFVVLLICLKPKNNKYEQIKSESSTIVNMIKSGDLPVKSNGCIVLPKELSHISDSGECFIVEFENNTAIYFYSFRGVTGSSKGYLYVTEKLSYADYINTDVYVGTMEFINIVKIEENWYSCSTD